MQELICLTQPAGRTAMPPWEGDEIGKITWSVMRSCKSIDKKLFENPDTEHSLLNSLTYSLFNSESLSVVLSGSNTLSYTQRHSHSERENRWTVTGTSEPDQLATPNESEQEDREGMDDSNAAACHAFYTSSLLTIQTFWAPGGPKALKPHC